VDSVSPEPPVELDRAAELIAGADALLYCAGAGIGVDSGLPDFRGTEGFWRAYPPYQRLGLAFEELADPVHFVDDPELAWGFYGHRLALYRATVPHAGFGALLEWATAERPARVFTSNVDGQFQRAGFADESVVECHGSIHHLQCLAGCTGAIWPADDVEVGIDAQSMRAVPPLPSCPRCGGLARPNILMFGDRDWLPARTEATARTQVQWLRGLRADGARLVVLEIGAGTAVPTVRRHAELAAAGSGALIRINTREPAVRHGRGVSIAAPAAATLTALATLLP
jgi:NAD-dependent SIR2 family protein deacetylase